MVLAVYCFRGRNAGVEEGTLCRGGSGTWEPEVKNLVEEGGDGVLARAQLALESPHLSSGWELIVE